MKLILFFGIVLFAAQPAIANVDSSDVVKAGFSAAERQYSYMLNQCKDLSLYPRSANPNGQTTFTTIGDWTGGFWPGCLWYVYEYSKDEKWKSAAIKWTESLEKNQYNRSHHDIGFMMNCSYGNAYRLTQNESYKKILIQSAKSLASRYNPRVGAIKSWNIFKSWDGKSIYHFPVIIDNMMNLELLFLASRLSGDQRFRDIAIKHAQTTLKNHYRSDYSSFHVVNYDEKTGKVLSKETVQGFSDNSAWSRGQAWGLYGFTTVYKETKQKKFLNAAIKMAQFYINNKNLPSDKIPYWDFNVGQEGYKPNWHYEASKFPAIPRDASAAAITSSALLELCKYVKGQQKDEFYHEARQILQSLSSDQYTARPGTNGYFILKHSVGSIPHGGEIDVPLVYADYYYLEALLRFTRFQL